MWIFFSVLIFIFKLAILIFCYRYLKYIDGELKSLKLELTYLKNDCDMIIKDIGAIECSLEELHYNIKSYIEGGWEDGI